MAWTTPRTYVAGELMTAAIGNTHWRDNLALLKTSISDDGLTWSGLVTGRFTYAATVTVSTPVFDLAQTWNDGAVTFTGLKFNVTDTASAAASLLLDLQVGGASKFKVQKDGTITAAAGLTATTGAFSGASVVLSEASAVLSFTGATAPEILFSAANGRLFANGSFVFGIDKDNNSTTEGFYWRINNATNVMELTETGRLGIGISPTRVLHVFGSIANFVAAYDNNNATPLGMQFQYSGATPNSTTAQFLYCNDATALRLEVRSNGGIANFSANNVNLSDLGAKDISGPAPSQRSKIKRISMYRGRYKDSNRTHDDLMWGAQDILAIDPEWVDVWQEEVRDENGAIVKPRLLGTRDHLIFLATVGVVAEHDALIDDHETRIKRLEDKKAA